MNSTSVDGFCLLGEGFVRRPLALLSLVTIGALYLTACGSDGGGLAPSMETGGAGGVGGNQPAAGGSGGDSRSVPPSTGGAAQGACMAPAPKVIATAGLGALRLTASGSDLYLIDTSDDFITSIRHLKEDGSGDSKVYTSPDISTSVQDMVVAGDTIYFVERTRTGYALVYRIPTSGGNRATITKGEGYDSGGADLGGANTDSVFVSVPNDTGQELRRVSIKDGTETIIAEHKGLVFTDMQIVGSDLWFLANQGLDGYFKVSLAATTSSATQVSMTGCTFESSVTPAGVFCSGALSLQRMPLTGGAFTKIWELPDGPVDVSRPDGDFVYLVPKSTPDSPGTLYRYPIMGGNPTYVSCNRPTMSVPVFNDRALFWLEADAKDDSKMNVYSVAKQPM